MSAAIVGRHSRHPGQPRRRFGFLPVRRRSSAIADAIEAGRHDQDLAQARASLQETLASLQETSASLQDARTGAAPVAPFTGASLEPLPAPPRPLAVPVMTEPELATLARVADRLRALPAEPEREPERDEDGLPPSAYLRAVLHEPAGMHALPGMAELGEPLGRTPLFAGATRTISGQLIAGMYLGTNEDGYCMVDATSAEWCEDAITALTAMRDALRGGRRPVPEDDTMLLRPVPAAAEGGAL
jgi:hypothetical protein